MNRVYCIYAKRCIDSLAASVGLVILLPLLLLVIMLLCFVNDGKPFFFQCRPGKDGRVFKVIKFKTMNDKRDKGGNLLPDKERLTSVGRFIRKTSVDEIPQLINIVKGDMSLIGPRPLRVDYLPLYSEEQQKRHCVRPGITGLAQVNGRNTISWTEKFKYDVYYVEHLSFLLDVKIFFKTIQKVCTAKDINATTEVTMEKFNGNN